MKRIEESGMVFEFEEDVIFQIEKSELHLNLGEGIKTVEFIVSLKADELLFVEAKSSSPQPTAVNKENFDVFIREISDKFLHSYNMYLSAVLKRNPFDKISEKLLGIELDRAMFKFILIIKGHKIEWLPPLKDAFTKELIAHNKIWNSKVIMMNEEIAKEYNLVKEWGKNGRA